ncbi:Serine/threonine protein kinase [Micromonospora avicenniae]|uniref:non-specific serine/threonine protein kinase n=1 Tax=Micromonospora avicenniae TaxID=1198245 RepID=A0A1N6SSK1_9ACTN|nr:Serine/threonine protein kinase [Micromonospora avicenniae]
MLTEGVVLSDRYRLSERVATGGMGAVWRCTDLLLEREVAVKVLLSTLVADAEFATRFRAEARMLAALRHPGVVAVHDVGQATLADGTPVDYLVMEYVEGEPLGHWIGRAGRLDAASTMSVVAQAADALHGAHVAGIVHRDVKPGNLLVRPDGRVVLVDFGIARSPALTGLTAANIVLGTALYMSPEQGTGQPVSAASDVYALGAVAYLCLAGRPPFVGENPLEVALRHQQDEPEPLPPGTPPAVIELVARAMAKRPADRFGSAAEMARAATEARRAILAASPHSARPPWASTGATPTAPPAPVHLSQPPLPATPAAPGGTPPPPAPVSPAHPAPVGPVHPAPFSPARPASPAVPGDLTIVGAAPAGPGAGHPDAAAPPAGSAAPTVFTATPGFPAPPADVPLGFPTPGAGPSGYPTPGGPSGYPTPPAGFPATPPSGPAGFPTGFAGPVPMSTPIGQPGPARWSADVTPVPQPPPADTLENPLGSEPTGRSGKLIGAGAAVLVALAATIGLITLRPGGEPGKSDQPPALTAESAAAREPTPVPNAVGTAPARSPGTTPSATRTASPGATGNSPTGRPGAPEAPAGGRTATPTGGTDDRPTPSTTSSRPEKPNPYTAAQACGSGYQVIDSATLTDGGGLRRGRVYLLYNAANGNNCVVTLKDTAVGTKTAASAYLEVKGQTRRTDSGSFQYYAGPVRAAAAGTCVKWGGSTGGVSYGSPFEHCD